jgi:hypothetical protein
MDNVPINNIPPSGINSEVLNQERLTIEFGIQDKRTVKLNGKELSLKQNPYIDEGVLMIPIQEVLATIGEWSSFDFGKGVLTVHYRERQLNGYLNSNYIFVENQRRFLLKELSAKDGRVFVPIDFFVTGLGFEAKKDEEVIRLTTQ